MQYDQQEASAQHTDLGWKSVRSKGFAPPQAPALPLQGSWDRDPTAGTITAPVANKRTERGFRPAGSRGGHVETRNRFAVLASVGVEEGAILLSGTCCIRGGGSFTPGAPGFGLVWAFTRLCVRVRGRTEIGCKNGGTRSACALSLANALYAGLRD